MLKAEAEGALMKKRNTPCPRELRNNEQTTNSEFTGLHSTAQHPRQLDLFLLKVGVENWKQVTM